MEPAQQCLSLPAHETSPDVQPTFVLLPLLFNLQKHRLGVIPRVKYGACGARVRQCSLQFSTVPGFVDQVYIIEGPVVANLYSMSVSVKHCALLTLGNGASQSRSEKQDMI